MISDGVIIANVDVSVDGTWQRRGHNSKTGVVFIISILTGEVLDYEVKTLFCHECVAHKSDDKTTLRYQQWVKNHVCDINHSGSSDSMETTAAVEMFTRSVEKHNLKYTTFVGDGDSSCFAHVKEARFNKYGDSYVVRKEECVGHIQKRIGRALREYKRRHKGIKLADHKSVGGPKRLTDAMIDHIQNFYGQAIRNNNNLQSMQNAIWAIFYHMIKDETLTVDEQHKYCPQSPDRWCKFWFDNINGTTTYLEKNRLDSIFKIELEPIFRRLTSAELLESCLKGLTQNQNESINSILWSLCPKNKFCGRSKLLLAVADTVLKFNTGSFSRSCILKSIGCQPKSNIMCALRREDGIRVYHAERKISMVSRIARRKRRAERKAKSDSTILYLAGGFGLSKEPENVSKAKRKKKENETVNILKEKEMIFVDDNDVQLIRNYNMGCKEL